MDILDVMVARLAESNLPDETILQMKDMVNSFAEKHSDNPDILARVAQVKTSLADKLGNKVIKYHQGTEKDAAPMSSEEYTAAVGKLRKLKEDPLAYMDECEKILRHPRNSTLAEFAIDGLGEIVAEHPHPLLTSRAADILRLGAENDRLMELDVAGYIGMAMKQTAEKFPDENGWLAGKYADQYAKDRRDLIVDRRLQELFPQYMAEQRAPVADAVENGRKAVAINEDNLPVLRLAGEYGVDFDLKEIAEAIKGLKPGEKLAIGRDPEKAGVSGNIHKIDEKKCNAYVSGHHCDIVRGKDGKLGLVDVSRNGTEVVERAEAGRKAVAINEDNLPVLRLAGEHGVDFDLKEIAEAIKGLRPGEKLAIGRDPEKAGISGNAHKIDEKKCNAYVSRHHCDIVRGKDGKLSLVDVSTNGTEVVDRSQAERKAFAAWQLQNQFKR